MSKELSPLETYHLLCERFVEEINETEGKNVAKDYFYNKKYEVGFRDKETGKIGYTADIETALKDYEKQKKLIQTLQDKIYAKEMKYAKQEKALEIIKDKSVDVGFLQYCSCVHTYNKYIVEHAWTKHTKILTQEEFNLLKEVLL